MIKEESLRETDLQGILYNDVCTTCNHVKLCNGKKSKQTPVWFCEEFDDYVNGTEKNKVGAELQLIPPWKDKRPPGDSIRLKGLCINCENRNACGGAGVEGGVWHCEEYC